MADESSLASFLVTSIIYEKKYSYCRLCLLEITDSFVCFEDNVPVGPKTPKQTEYRALSEVITDIGMKIPEEIPGLEAVCIKCVQLATQSYNFMTQCQENNKKLSSLINSLNESLVIKNSALINQKNILIVPNFANTKIIFANKTENIVKRKKVINTPNEKQVKCVCEECEMEFYKISDFKKHNLDVHNVYTCSKCLETFVDANGLDGHSSKDHKYKCSHCSQYRSTQAELQKHEETIHFGYVCKHCGKTLRQLKSLHHHEAKHEDKVFSCPKCNKKYSTREYFDRHRALCVKGLLDPHPIRSDLNRQFICGDCGKKYSTKSSLRVHLRFEHGNAKHHICKQCDMKFTAPSYLRMHMVKHTRERNFHCDLCKKVFVTKEALLYHTRRHTGEKPYSCKYCKERFVNASSRAEHIKFKHVGPQLSCDVCSKKFVTLYFLRKHQKRHDNPASKLYTGRNMFPPNIPGELNMRIKIEE